MRKTVNLFNCNGLAWPFQIKTWKVFVKYLLLHGLKNRGAEN